MSINTQIKKVIINLILQFPRMNTCGIRSDGCYSMNRLTYSANTTLSDFSLRDFSLPSVHELLDGVQNKEQLFTMKDDSHLYFDYDPRGIPVLVQENKEKNYFPCEYLKITSTSLQDETLELTIMNCNTCSGIDKKEKPELVSIERIANSHEDWIWSEKTQEDELNKLEELIRSVENTIPIKELSEESISALLEK